MIFALSEMRNSEQLAGEELWNILDLNHSALVYSLLLMYYMQQHLFLDGLQVM